MAWVELPDLILSDVMMKVGFESLEGLHRCRQVCKPWNNLILRDIYQSENKRKIIKERIERNLGHGMFPSDDEISNAKWAVAGGILDTTKIQRLTERFRNGFNLESRINDLMCSASLAHNGLLNSVRLMALRDLDLSPVPAKQLASLASCVTSILRIQNVTGCDLASIISSVKCEFLIIGSQSLGRKETLALVQAMDARVEEVELHGEVTLDIEALSEYSGQGVCGEVRLYGNTRDRYREELRTWASNRNWRVIVDEDGMFKCKCNIDVITRIKNTFFRMLTNY